MTAVVDLAVELLAYEEWCADWGFHPGDYHSWEAWPGAQA